MYIAPFKVSKVTRVEVVSKHITPDDYTVLHEIFHFFSLCKFWITMFIDLRYHVIVYWYLL